MVAVWWSPAPSGGGAVAQGANVVVVAGEGVLVGQWSRCGGVSAGVGGGCVRVGVARRPAPMVGGWSCVVGWEVVAVTWTGLWLSQGSGVWGGKRAGVGVGVLWWVVCAWGVCPLPRGGVGVSGGV